MEFEILFWLAMATLNVFLLARIVRRMRTRAYADTALAEAFERHRRAKIPAAAEPSYARERYSRDEWAA